MIRKIPLLGLYWVISAIIFCSTLWCEEAELDSVVASGTILCDGEPASGASVYLYHEIYTIGFHSTDLRFLGMSGSNGTFEVTVPNSDVKRKKPGGIYTLFFNHPDYSFAFHRLRRHYSTQDLTIILYPASSLSGVVFDENGDSVSGAEVYICSVSNLPNIARGIPVLEDTTGIDGRFSLNNLPRNTEISFYAEAPGYAARLVSVPVGADDIEVSLTPSGGISGRVVDGRSGLPIPETKLQISRHQNVGRHDDNSYGETRTGPDGQFTIDGLAPGPYRVRAHFNAAGIGKIIWVEDNIPVEPGCITDDTEIVFQTGEWGVVTGRITERVSGNPLKGMGVNVKSDDVPWFKHRIGWEFTSGVTDADGRYYLTFTEGNVKVSASGYNEISNVVHNEHTSIAAGDTTQGIDFKLTRRISIQGIVTMPDGSPATGAIVKCGWLISSRSNRQGKVTMEWLVPGHEYPFEANLGDSLTLTTKVIPRANETFELVLQPVEYKVIPNANETFKLMLQPVEYIEVHGNVVYDDHSPAANIPLTLYRGLPKDLISVYRNVAAVTDSQGNFIVTGIIRRGENYQYLISADHNQIRTQYFMPKNDVGPFQLVLQKVTHRIEGRVVDHKENPISEARVSVWLKNKGHWETVTGEEGAFVLEGLYPTEADIGIGHFNYGHHSFKAVHVDTLQVFTLTKE